MPEPTLRFVARTPHAEVLRRDLGGLRVPTETGWVGILPHTEGSVLVVEPGLVLMRQGELTSFAGTAGGILRVEREGVTLLAPIVVSGESVAVVQAALDEVSTQASQEMELRRRIDHLERALMAQSRDARPVARSRRLGKEV